MSPLGERLLPVLDVGVRHARRGRGAQQADVDVVQPRGVDVGRGLLHLGAGLRELVDQRLKLVGILAVDVARRIGELHGDAELLQRSLLAFRQRDLQVAAIVRIGPRHDVERDIEVLRRARERPDHRNIRRRDRRPAARDRAA